LAALLVASAAPAAAELSAEEQAIVGNVVSSVDEQLAFLEKVVNINSDSMNHEGVKAVGAEFGAAFEGLGFETKWLDLPAEANRAGHLVATRAGDRGNKLLLIGHLDTVFAKDGDFQEFRREGDKAFGPGVNDMKGGNVVVLYALKALQKAGALDGAQVTVFFTGDEEMPGKPISASRGALIDAAKAADVALNFEGGEEGAVVTARRGSSGWKLTTTGLRRHSSGIFSEEVGAGAVFEQARILSEFYDKMSDEKFLTFNPGVIVGGTDVDYDKEASKGSAFGKTNVVASKTVTDGGLRFISEEQKEKARERMRKIVDKNLPQTDATIEFEDSYPAMTPTDGNMELLGVFSAVSEDLGHGSVTGNDPGERGAADISFAAPHVPASMDGLGVTGEGAHSPDEYMDVPSLKLATERAAIFIYRLTREGAPAFRSGFDASN
jgi:glutamate carboxypeptidase